MKSCSLVDDFHSFAETHLQTNTPNDATAQHTEIINQELGKALIQTGSIPVAVRSKAWFAAARLMGLQVQIPQEALMSVSCECCVLSGTGLCVGLISHPEESHPVWCPISAILQPRQ